MMRNRVMRIGDASFRIGSRARLACELESNHARHIALQSECLEIPHQLGMIAIRCGNADRPVDIRKRRIAGLLLSLLNAPLHLANRVQIFTQLGSVAGAELALKAREVFIYPVEYARILLQFCTAFRRTAPVPEQALEDVARMSLGRERRCRRRPG